MTSRVELHLHTHYSLMDGLNTAKEYVQVAAGFGMPAIGITDHGTLSGHRDMQIACREQGIKPILGVEAYISATDRFDRRSIAKRDDNTQVYNHIILLAKDEAGLKNLHHMSREAWQGGFYSKPRVDWELLDQYGDGIIVLSGCMNGLIARALEREDMQQAEELAQQYKDRFGEDFYMEVQPHNPPELNEGLLLVADKFGIKPVATTDCHFTRPELRWVEEAMLILSTSPKRATGKDYRSTQHIKDIFDRFREMYPERPISFEEIDVYLMNREEAELGFKHQGIERQDIIDNTFEIANRIGDYEFLEGEELLPEVALDPSKELRSKVRKGLQELGLDNEQYRARADEELDVLARKNFEPYFLIVADMVQYAREQDIFVGPGRGSAAGSLVCYALGITQVDPIKHGLLFFRFIDESREDWPDIDLDFEKSRRGEIKEYLRDKYGHVASISNFIYFKDKGVVRDAARVYGVPIAEVNKALEQVDKWDDFLTTTASATVDFRKNYPDVVELAENLRGRIRSVGMHAAGVVTSSVPIEDYAPFETRSDPNDKVSGRVPVVAWDMKQCADVGLIKLDILGLNTLDVVHETLDFIKHRSGESIDLLQIPLDDERVFETLSSGRTVGVFQCDASPYRSLLMEMGVDNFGELVISNALVRPGARNTVGEAYINRKNGVEQIEYVHDLVRPVLEETAGLCIYQEQVMQLATELGGMSKSDANKLRNIIGKKRDVLEFEVYRERFVEGASKHIDVEAAEQLWHDFEAHAGYSFNKSHSVAYSLLSYWTAWLKINYPLEFMTALLRNEGDKDKRVEVFIEMRQLGLTVKLPHINLSDEKATIVDDYIRLGLTDVKYISDGVFHNIDRERPFDSYADVDEAAKRKGSGINSRAVSSLGKVGALPFDDSPYDEDVSANLYEYLRIPRFKGKELPWQALEFITKMQDYAEDETYIIKAMVTNLKRGKTKAGKEWVRVEVIDETGKAGIFCDPDDTPEAGQMYVFLVTWNRIMKAVPIDEFDENNDAAFVKFMYNGSSAGKGEVEVLAIEKRFTAKKQMMATFVAANSKGEMRRVLVFPQMFGKAVRHLKEGSVLRVKVKTLDDESLALREIL